MPSRLFFTIENIADWYSFDLENPVTGIICKLLVRAFSLKITKGCNLFSEFNLILSRCHKSNRKALSPQDILNCSAACSSFCSNPEAFFISLFLYIPLDLILLAGYYDNCSSKTILEGLFFLHVSNVRLAHNSYNQTYCYQLHVVSEKSGRTWRCPTRLFSNRYALNSYRIRPATIAG